MEAAVASCLLRGAVCVTKIAGCAGYGRRIFGGALREAGLLGDDDAADEDIIGIGNFLAAALHVFEAEFNGFANVGERFVDRFPL